MTAEEILTQLITEYHKFSSKRKEGVLTLKECASLNYNLFISENYRENYSTSLLLRVSELISLEFVKLPVKSALEAATNQTIEPLSDYEKEAVLNAYNINEIK